jgi:4-alpha-glucanotransferase
MADAGSAHSGLPRASGVLLHPTALPGPHGCGDLGAAAHAFLDLLHQAGQRYWQVLPLGPPGLGDSPYMAGSAFAGNPLLVALEPLQRAGLLEARELEGAPAGAPERADFAAARAFKLPRLERAYQRFLARGGSAEPDYLDFREHAAGWLEDYALFEALHHAQAGRAWQEWPSELARRDPAALATARERLARDVGFQRFLQYQFSRQWRALHQAARERGVQFVGDIPIFVAPDSADVWARPEQFKLDPAGRLLRQAGVPPDYFAADGQLWGNPLYNWDRQTSDGFAWWVERFRATLEQVDLVRIDHFRGFQACWEVPAEARTAREGEWVAGPGAALFQAVAAQLGPPPILAEDLGLITPDVVALRERLGYPGMRVLQFGFDGNPNNPHLPHAFVRNCVAYTGTHDNDTTEGWFATLEDAARARLRRYLSPAPEPIHRGLARLALASVADTAILPLQDVLGLGGEARMNVPGRAHGNWAWRVRPDQLHPDRFAWLADLTETYGRVPGS